MKLAVRYGVEVADGDGTVPLMSLGYMCVKGWNDVRRILWIVATFTHCISQSAYNPARTEVITREYPHTLPQLLATNRGVSIGDVMLRGGISTAGQ
jgi:phospholipid:diacylglycerol acyltransferase